MSTTRSRWKAASRHHLSPHRGEAASVRIAIADPTDRRRSDDEDQGGGARQRDASSSTAKHDATATERFLDESPRCRGECDGDHHQPDPKDEVVARSCVGRHADPERHRPEDQDRPVPQVEGVRDPTEPPQRRPGERDPSGRPEDATGGDQRDRAERRYQRGQARIGRRRTDRHELAPSNTAPSQPTAAATAFGTRPSRGEQRASNPPAASCQARVGSEKYGPGARRVRQRRAEEERAGEDRGRERGHRESRTPETSDGQQQERPQQVELLLDRQRPEMEHRRGIHGREVVGGADGEAYVRERQAGREAVIGDPPKIQRRHDEPRRQERRDEHEQGGRKDASGTACVERAKSDPSRVFSFVREQPRDQEPRQDEEDVHPDEAGLGSGDPDVAEEDEQDGDAAQTLEVRPVPGFGSPRRGHRSPQWPHARCHIDAVRTSEVWRRARRSNVWRFGHPNRSKPNHRPFGGIWIRDAPVGSGASHSIWARRARARSIFVTAVLAAHGSDRLTTMPLATARIGRPRVTWMR